MTDMLHIVMSLYSFTMKNNTPSADHTSSSAGKSHHNQRPSAQVGHQPWMALVLRSLWSHTCSFHAWSKHKYSPVAVPSVHLGSVRTNERPSGVPDLFIIFVHSFSNHLLKPSTGRTKIHRNNIWYLWSIYSVPRTDLNNTSCIINLFNPHNTLLWGKLRYR